jgi:hypothetical protein
VNRLLVVLATRVPSSGTYRQEDLHVHVGMTRDRFGLSNLRFYAHHGAAEHERTVGRWFSADVEMSVDLDRAARTEDLHALQSVTPAERPGVPPA